MQSTRAALRLDLSYSHWREGAVPFVIEIGAEAIGHLIDDANEGRRVYELFAVRRPGDVLKYLWVQPEALPKRIEERAAGYRLSSAASDTPDLPFLSFDGFFADTDYDCDHEDEAWMRAMREEHFRSFVDACFARLRTTQNSLRRFGDALIRNELALIDRFEHPFDRRPNAPWLRTPRFRADENNPLIAQLCDATKALLSSEAVDSVAVRGSIPYALLRLLCTEQLRRSANGDRKPSDAFPVSVLDDRIFDVTAWGAGVRWHMEGLGQGDLHIELGRSGGLAIPDLLQHGYRSGAEVYLCMADQGDIEGYLRGRDRDLYIYRRKEPRSRHARHALLSHSGGSTARPVLNLSRGEQHLVVNSTEPFVLLIDAKTTDEKRAQRNAFMLAELERESLGSFFVLLQPDLPLEFAGCQRFVRLFDAESATYQTDREIVLEHIGKANVVIVALERKISADALALLHAARDAGATTGVVAPFGLFEDCPVDLIVSGRGLGAIAPAAVSARRGD